MSIANRVLRSRLVRWGLFALGGVVLAGGLLAYELGQPQRGLPVVETQIGQTPVRIEVASTILQLSRGLMFREHLGANEGMLLDFGAPGIHCLWMKNTLVDLSAAFIDQNGVVVWLADMEAGSESPVCPGSPVVKVLEMNQGWFSANGVRLGKVLFSPGQ